MKPSLVPYLCCLSCGSPLRLQIDDSIEIPGRIEHEVLSGSLLCSHCRDEYLITEGVPRIVRHHLSTPKDIYTGRRFAEAWKEFPRLDERYRKQFYDWVSPVNSDFVRDKIVLEAGCGKGRHAKIVAEDGAKLVIGVDIGDAVDVAYKQLGHLPNVHLVQCDIRNLPFRQIFDFAFSVGVLHHMTHPEDGFTSLVKTLKPDGSLCVWVYGRENNGWLVHLISPLRHCLTSKLPPRPLRSAAGLVAIPVFFAAKFFFRPYTRLKVRWRWLPKVFYEQYLSYIATFDFVEIHHIVFDHLTAPVAYYVLGCDVQTWFKNAGLYNCIIRWHNENSWTGFASRAAPVSRNSLVAQPLHVQTPERLSIVSSPSSCVTGSDL